MTSCSVRMFVRPISIYISTVMSDISRRIPFSFTTPSRTPSSFTMINDPDGSWRYPLCRSSAGLKGANADVFSKGSESGIDSVCGNSSDSTCVIVGSGMGVTWDVEASGDTAGAGVNRDIVKAGGKMGGFLDCLYKRC